MGRTNASMQLVAAFPKLRFRQAFGIGSAETLNISKSDRERLKRNYHQQVAIQWRELLLPPSERRERRCERTRAQRKDKVVTSNPSITA
jgi:hypothetical protein